MKYLRFLLLLLPCLTACAGVGTEPSALIVEGVSNELATYRKETINGLSYELTFNLPSDKTEKVTGSVVISFSLDKHCDVIVDFQAPKENLKGAKLNGSPFDVEIVDEHIFFPANITKNGANTIELEFISPNTSLNRRDEFMYTLLVPDRARTLFPMFEQPDLKASYTLTLNMPESWTAITNSASVSSEVVNGVKSVDYATTEPISSYLFAFAAGEFEMLTREHKGRVHHIYHRETDSLKLTQMNDIYDELFHSLDWLEEYTAIPYPFSKYDMVLLPGFQYGGMEHVGATFYNASTMFVSPTPTLDERVRRAKLVAHETSHMWFGDLVTMEWFDDVWTKEVFANYFAARIIAPLFPESDERQAMLDYFSYAYSEDRTAGATAIKQELDNLKYAGLVYNNIIYNKSPLVLNMLAEKLGESAFRDAVRQALKTYSYDNASWEEWLAVFDAHSSDDIVKWADTWMYKSGMPHISITANGCEVTVEQKDPTGRGLLWEQKVSFTAVLDSVKTANFSVDLKNAKEVIVLPFAPRYIIPNNDGMAYGYFSVDAKSMGYLIVQLASIPSSVERRVALTNIYENVLNNPKELSAPFLVAMLSAIPNERDPKIYSSMLSYMSNIYNNYFKHLAPTFERMVMLDDYDELLWSEYESNPNAGFRVLAFGSIYSNMLTSQTKRKVYEIWENKSVVGITLAESSYMDMSYKLAITFPERADEIVATQKRRITNPDQYAQYNFISKAVAESGKDRTRFFMTLLEEEGREVESWTQTALALLMAEREKDNVRDTYLTPALMELVNIQRTGDIFFPQGWCRALLAPCTQEAAYDAVQNYLKANPNINPMLRSKLLIASDHLFRLYAEEN